MAQARGAGQAIAFEIDKVELELQIVVSRRKLAMARSPSGCSAGVED